MRSLKLFLCAMVTGLSLSATAVSVAADEKPAATSESAPATATDKAARKQKKAECYKQANAQNLHGKKRKSFVHSCMKN